MKVALVYDRVNKWGGAERVLLALNKIFPDAPLYTSVYSTQKAPWAKVFPKVRTSFLQKLPFTKDRHELLPYLMPLAFESFSTEFDEFDLVFSVTSEAAKGIITKTKTRHICYCLTPTRYLWSAYDDYFKNPLFRVVSLPAVGYLRAWDKLASQRPDEIIAISTAVAERIKKYYKRDSKIIYPPVNTEKFKALNSKTKRQKQKYYLVVSRLVPYKRVDLVIEAFNELGYPLYIIGTGSQKAKLKRMAKGNIKFVKNLTDSELADYYQKAKALVLAQEEDFGIAAVEAQAAGTPVIAFARGGVRDTVKDGVTGVLFRKQTKKDLIKAIKDFEKRTFKKEVLQENAEKFSEKKFEEKIINLVKNV